MLGLDLASSWLSGLVVSSDGDSPRAGAAAAAAGRGDNNDRHHPSSGRVLADVSSTTLSDDGADYNVTTAAADRGRRIGSSRSSRYRNNGVMIDNGDEEEPPPPGSRGDRGGNHKSIIRPRGSSTRTALAGGAGAVTTGSSIYHPCQPYKVEVLDRELLGHRPGADRRAAVIDTLRSMGVKVFVIDAQNAQNAGTVADVVAHIRRVVGFVAREKSRISNTPHNNNSATGLSSSQSQQQWSPSQQQHHQQQQQQQRVLFYQDEQGRLFNLILSPHVTGPAGTWREYMETFSGPEALVALTLLCRSLPCIVTAAAHNNDDSAQNLKPAYLAVVLGLVLTEEISLSWLNASMMIRATPSVSAHALTSSLSGSDWLRKLVLFTLAFASATSHWGLTMAGVVGAMILLLANLGARSWHALGWRPLRYTGPGSFWIAYLLAVGTGLVFPYMGHATIATGGKGAMEYVLRTAVLVAVVFILSDIDELQRFLVVGSEDCDQDYVNMGVGSWWLLTVIGSLVWCRQIPYREQAPGDGERLLEDSQASPVGYKVPSLPDFEIDPTLANTGIKWLPMWLEFALGSLLAVAVGIWMIALDVTNWDERYYSLLGRFV